MVINLEQSAGNKKPVATHVTTGLSDLRALNKRIMTRLFSALLQDSNGWQCFAFNEFQERTTTGGDVRNLISDFVLIHSS